MNLSINPNYQNFSFTGSKQKTIAAITASLAAAAATANVINGNVSYHQVLTDKINNNSIFINNKNIQANKDTILSESNEIFHMPIYKHKNNLPVTDKLPDLPDDLTENRSEARIKVLDCYSESQTMQKNNLISDRIGTITASVKNNKQAELVVKMLKNNAANDDEKFFDSLAEMIRDNIRVELIEKVLTNRDFHSNISSGSLLKIRGYNKNVASAICSILDSYSYKYKDTVHPEQVEDILVESFKQLKEDQKVCAAKLFQQTADTNLDAEIDDALFNIASKDKDTLDELNQCINELRSLRDAVKNSYKNKLLEPVTDILNNRIEEYKSIREEEFGVAANSEADKNDSVEYEEIKAFWKE